MSRKYLDAAKVLEKVLAKKGSVKNLSLESTRNRQDKDKKFIFALVSETLKKKSILDQGIKSAGTNVSSLLYKEISNRALIYILLYEQLFGSGKIQGGGKVKRIVKSVEEKIREALVKVCPTIFMKVKIEEEGGSEEEELKVPKYLRVNTFKGNVSDVGVSLKNLYERHGYNVSLSLLSSTSSTSSSPSSSSSSSPFPSSPPSSPSSSSSSSSSKNKKKRKAIEMLAEKEEQEEEQKRVKAKEKDVDESLSADRTEGSTKKQQCRGKGTIYHKKNNNNNNKSINLTPHPLLNYVYLLPRKVDLYQEDFIQKGQAVIQDLSSCLPAHILINEWPEEEWNHWSDWRKSLNRTTDISLLYSQNEKREKYEKNGKNGKKIKEKEKLFHNKRGEALQDQNQEKNSKAPGRYTFLDACAAPGNKTSQLAMLVAERDRDQEKQQDRSKEIVIIKDKDNIKDRDSERCNKDNREVKSNPTEEVIARVTTRKCKDAASSSSTSSSSSSSSSSLPFHNQILAMDRDKTRLETLEKRVIDQYSCQNVTPVLGDFLAVDFEKDSRYQNIRGILLDPSCSGSGIVTSLERSLEKDDNDNNYNSNNYNNNNNNKRSDNNNKNNDNNNNYYQQQQKNQQEKQAKQRLTALSQFQYNALLKAFSCPTVERVVYSTCSIHMEENEQVVASALRYLEQQKQQQQDKVMKMEIETKMEMRKKMQFTFKLKPCLPQWSRRGIAFGEQQEQRGTIGNSSFSSSFSSCTSSSPSPSSKRENGESRGDSSLYLTEEEAQCLIRVDPTCDQTNGFFVSLFVKEEI